MPTASRADDISSLIDDLSDWNKDKAKQASDKLAAIGKPAVPYLIKALDSNSRNRKRYAARALRNIGQDASDAIPTLSILLKDSDARTREYAVEALGRMFKHADMVIPILKRAMDDSNKEVRTKAKLAFISLSNRELRTEEIMDIVKEQINSSISENKCIFIELKKDKADNNKYHGYIKFENGTKFHISVISNKQDVRYGIGDEFGPIYAKKQKQLGDQYFNNKEFNKSMEVYKLAINNDSNNIEARIGIGACQVELGYCDEAQVTLSNVLELDPNNIDAKEWLNKNDNKKELIAYEQKVTKLIEDANKARKSENYEKAIDLYNNAISLQPTSSQAHFGLGLVYQETKNYTKSLESFEKAFSINKDLAKLHPQLNEMLGVMYLEVENYPKAAFYYEKTIKNNPNKLELLENLLYAYKKSGQSEKAREIEIKINKIKPVGPTVKGFYLGMNINDAAKLLNEKHKDNLLEKGYYLVLVDKNISPAPDDVPIKVDGSEYSYDHFVSYNNEILYPHPQVVLLMAMMGLDRTIIEMQSHEVDIHADDDGLVDRIHFGENVVNMLFNVPDMDGEEFAQAFIDNYSIPKLEAKFDQISIYDIETGQKKYGYIWEYTSNEGFKITIQSHKELWIEKVPAKTERSFD
jgi:tetratricopeptide (TPR) repeat protein